eukprot:TRINITY_DN1291_c0_g4_i1.p2 TRINITY_DN1291_c0_g4~~TRINITY_DN1291_c0_g4_i1.p2  ORF type:complete len:155 (+),score=51.40 TRINITY_DN1291_c0_g4_i1:112-576(+)
MKGVHLPQAKLLFAVSSLLKSNAITNEESLQLKGIIFKQKEEFANSLVKDASEETIKERLLGLLNREPPKEEEDKDLELEVPQRNLEDPMMSPVDTYLMNAKKKRAKEKLSSADPHKGDEVPSLTAKINHCDIGKSPEMQKLAPLEQRIGFKDD